MIFFNQFDFCYLFPTVDNESSLHHEEDPRYRGGAIPSRAFRFLQTMTESGDAPVVNTSKFYSKREREREIFYHIRKSEMKPLLLQRNDHRPLLTRSRTGIRRLLVSKSIDF